jgi:prepilin-type N-terminal cleavage/methylation domain-containing protein
MTPRNARRGVTLVELLVVMSILTGLLALALMVIPNVNQQNAVLKGTGEVSATFKTAQAMAAATRMPRGVRFLTSGVGGNGSTANTLQYLEMPPIIVSDPQALVGINGDATGQNVQYDTRAEFFYNLAPPAAAAGAAPQNAVLQRHCYLRGLTLDQALQITPGATLVLPTMDSFSRITSATWIQPSPPLTSTSAAPGPYLYVSPRTGGAAVDVEAVLEIYPDAFLGTATSYRTFHFGIYAPPVPLLAEPTVLLPPGIVADLQISYPPLPQAAAAAGQNYDVMFSPSGQTLSTPITVAGVPVGGIAANTNVYIWIRDITKTTNPAGPNTTSMYAPDFGANYAGFVDAFRRAGEQQVVGVRSGGFIGTAPIAPPLASGSFATYAPTNGFQLAPFAFAQQRLDK